MKKKLTQILALLLILSLLWGCGAESAAGQDIYYRTEVSKDSVSAEAPNTGNSKPVSTPSLDSVTTETLLPAGRKLIRKVTMEAQTKEMDALLPQLEQQISAMGGYLERRELYNGTSGVSQWRTANLLIRIPSDRADAFLSELGSAANVISLNETLTDVTLDYVATESRIKALNAEQERLLELMDQAKTLSELLEVEARLTDVITELESAESQKRLYDNMIDYTSIQLTLRQVTELTTPEDEMTLWERISTGFMSTLTGLADTLVDLFVWLIVSSPVLVVLGVVAFGISRLVCFLRKKKNKSDKA